MMLIVNNDNNNNKHNIQISWWIETSHFIPLTLRKTTFL